MTSLTQMKSRIYEKALFPNNTVESSIGWMHIEIDHLRNLLEFVCIRWIFKFVFIHALNYLLSSTRGSYLKS